MPARKPLIDSLMDLSIPEPNSGCWLWMGCLCPDGYGKVYAKRELPGESLAHRASYKLFVGPIPDGCEIDHRCNVRSCINPEHLRAISHADNVRRSDHKKNSYNGRKTHCKRGHELSGDNLVIWTYGGQRSRQCRTCVRERQRKVRRWRAA